MAVDTSGRVRMRGDSGPGTAVRVWAGDGRLQISAGEDRLGDWDIHEIGIKAAPEGFLIRAEGEEFLLRSEDEVALAEEFGLAAATPRLARKVAASHNPEISDEPTVEPVFPEGRSNASAIALALGGVLVLLGGTFLRNTTAGVFDQSSATTGVFGVEFWVAFVMGGLLMVALAFVMSLGSRWARLLSLLVIAGIVAVFGYALSVSAGSSSQFTAYGFIAGGVVVGVAVLFSGSEGGSG